MGKPTEIHKKKDADVAPGAMRAPTAALDCSFKRNDDDKHGGNGPQVVRCFLQKQGNIMKYPGLLGSFAQQLVIGVLGHAGGRLTSPAEAGKARHKK